MERRLGLYGKLLRDASKGNEKAIGATAFEAAMLFTPMGMEEGVIQHGVEALEYSGEVIDVYSFKVLNSGRQEVIRKMVTSENDLLKIAENAAGGSLDNFVEFKPNWWEGELNGEKI